MASPIEGRRFEHLWERTKAEIPGARIVNKKNSAFMQTIFTVLTFLVKVFTLGRGKADWSGYTTTIWRTMYVPADFFHWRDEDKYRLLRHELVHLRQFRRWPLAFLEPVWPVNAVIMSFCYILVLPVILTFRARFECAGYTQSMLSWFEIHKEFTPHYRAAKADQMADTFGGSAYFFMSTRNKSRTWAHKTMDNIELGDISNEHDNVDAWPYVE